MFLVAYAKNDRSLIWRKMHEKVFKFRLEKFNEAKILYTEIYRGEIFMWRHFRQRNFPRRKFHETKFTAMKFPAAKFITTKNPVFLVKIFKSTENAVFYTFKKSLKIQ